jgi:hypothetical protein
MREIEKGSALEDGLPHPAGDDQPATTRTELPPTLLHHLGIVSLLGR